MVRQALFLCLAGCSSLLGISDLEGPPDGGPPPPPDDGMSSLTDCKAQRVVHLVAGTGGLAWFTLVWPVPGVIKFYQATYAYDDPALTKDISIDLGHQLFIRRIGAVGHGVWEDSGTDPQPSIFLAGSNETHTNAPTSTIRSGGNGLLAAAAAIQVGALAPPVPVLAFEQSAPYGTAPNAPTALVAVDVDPAITMMQALGKIDSIQATALKPSSIQLARYFPMGAPPPVVSLGTRLAFTANALKMGLFGSVQIPAFNDDPHGAFATGGVATGRANQLAAMLDAFYADLATGNELACGKDGQALSLADNVVMMVNGDTMKDSYVNSGWPDGTAGNANVMYVRSNGFTKFGWFGELQPGNIRLTFEPSTGQSGQGTAQADTESSFAATLYAIARGDRTLIAPYTMAEIDGMVTP